MHGIEKSAGTVSSGRMFHYVETNRGGAAAVAIESGQVGEGFPRVSEEARAIALDGLGGGGI